MKRFISLFLAILMVITMIPISVFADEMDGPNNSEHSYLQIEKGEKNMFIIFKVK